ncbi:MAG: hypothetical protein KDM63_03310, partial [Verrucomicrobiae bacterium]|nr:hypothetical protein [Verrucomicrobiae bacterium]
GRLDVARRIVAEAERLWRDLPAATDAGRRSMEVSILTARGQVERLAGNGEEAMAAYDRALRLLAESEAGEERDGREANLRVCRGLAALSGDSEADWRRAIEDFDAAILARSKSVDSPAARWGRAAAWINRGEAFGKLGGREDMEEVLRSNDEAIRCLEDFDLCENPAFRTRLALARMNQGLALARLCEAHGDQRREFCLEAFTKAAGVLRPGLHEGNAETPRVLAVVLANSSRTRFAFAKADSPEGEVEAREALSLIAESDPGDWELTRLDLSLRLTLCGMLERGVRAMEISDLAEEGLDRLRRARVGGEPPSGIPELAGQLLLQGAEAYLESQARFLCEYLLDYLDPERHATTLADWAPCQEAATRVLWKAVGRFQRDGFGSGGPDDFHRELDLQDAVQQCRQRLAQVRAVLF